MQQKASPYHGFSVFAIRTYTHKIHLTQELKSRTTKDLPRMGIIHTRNTIVYSITNCMVGIMVEWRN